MTISYTREVATCTGLGAFWKLLFKWKGSVYKLVWQNLLLYMALYFSLSILYRFGLNEPGKSKFEQITMHCERFSDLIPVTFVLGFYVSIIITRWWGQYKVIPWPDSCCLFISTCIQGQDDRGRLMRRTIARYLILALIQTLRMTSVQVKKRFPTLDHVCEAGIVTENEKKIIEDVEQKCIQHPKYWMSLVWAGAVVTRAKKEGRIKDEFTFQAIITEINKFRSGCGGLLDYDWISIPLVYTQVVTLAVYSFFVSSLMGRQFLDPTSKLAGHEVDLYVPVFTFLQFFFYMGWLKVAEVLINPFGEDDEDFEMNWLIDRNLQVAYLIVDDMHAEHPELVKDQYWDEGVPDELPYTVASEQFRTDGMGLGSTADDELSPEDQEIILMDRIDEGEESDDDQIKMKIATEPVTIGNGVGSNRGSLAESQTLRKGSAENRGSNRSVMAMLQSMIKGGSSTNLNKRNGSSASIFSTATKYPNRQLRRRKKTYASRASTLSSPRNMSRVQTKENEIFKMSSNSSVNTYHSESDFPSRSNSDAHALKEVRDLLKNDLNKYHGTLRSDAALVLSLEGRDLQGSQTSIQSPDASGVSLKNRRKEHRHKPDALYQTKVLRKRLEQVQSLQRELMKELDSELKYSSKDHSISFDASEMVNMLENKTSEVREAMKRNKSYDDADTGCMSPTLDNSPFQNFSVPLPGHILNSSHLAIGGSHKNRSRKSSGISITHQMSFQQPSPGPSSPTEDIVAPPITYLGVPLGALPQSLSGHNVLTPAAALSSHKSLTHSQDLIFDIDPLYTTQELTRDGGDGGIGGEGVTSEPPGSDLPPEQEEEEDGEPWDNWDQSNLGTIQELPELGYQSDSSDTDQLLPKSRKLSPTKTKTLESDSLQTVPEDKPI
ncbi:uncharacterized protein LOC111710568 isoform X2 [Eurytemora carolleeae]|uniref:uncharacterized protein LOC111710568 isoform X1 n=1 Tax=Eurytemora carolleeae TaxID=1294199 RepID=UPI000C758FC8|nr:uncharacterized protein LOC111710568 isoform X1 [Eurytemora carolleeae]XP_023340442.1 uncharacterized protein LOC111710568 isoform X2 [Eurytemora carolleeae]|eukprot:XP_023340441.1 uncharacterized protein LOC111710568 isoform X1 [Eurytemora affinis]